MGNLPKISPITDEELDRINEKFGMDVDFSRRIGMRLTEAQKAMQENERLKRRIEELEQRLKAGQHETIVKYPKHNSTEMINYLLVNALRCLDKKKRHILTKSLVERDSLWKD